MVLISDNKYWIADNAVTIIRNALGIPDYIQVSVISGATIMVYDEAIPGLGYDAGHNYRRWSIVGSPTVFNTHTEKYVYVAIPRPNTASDVSASTNAMIVFPSEEIDVYGKNASEEQIGSDQFYYVYLHGKLSSSGDNGTVNREWLHEIVSGKLRTDEALSNPESPWYRYSSVDGIVRLVKDLTMEATTKFLNLYAQALHIVSGGEISFAAGGKVKKVAIFGNLTDDSADSIVTPDYLANRETKVEQKYLRKDQADSTDYALSASRTADNSYALQTDQFGNVIVNTLWAQFLAVFHADARSLEFISSLTTGKGWRIDKDGNMELESMKVRSALTVLELIKNKVSAQSGDFVFTESITAEEVTYNEQTGYYTLKAKENDASFCLWEDDIIRGVYGPEGNVRTCWLRVISDYEDAANPPRYYVDCEIIPDEETPAGENFIPTAKTVFHRWGNYTNPERQSCWYISSPEKRIVMLDGVNKPILEESNYAAFLGLPYGLSTFKGHSLKPDQPYLYVRGAFLQDLHIIDYKGQVVKTERFRGTWSAETAASADPYAVTETTFDTVYHNNAKYQCLVNGTTAEPTKTSTAWKFLEEALNAVYYEIETSYDVIHIDASGEYTPSSLSVKRIKVEGGERTVVSNTTMQYKVDGGSWTTTPLNVITGTIIKSAQNFLQLRLIIKGSNPDEDPSNILVVKTFPIMRDGKNGDKGDKGDTGAPLRGPMLWKATETYLSGATGEPYQDIVFNPKYNAQMFLCKVTNTNVEPSAETSAASAWDAAHPWYMTQMQEFVASRVMFAQKATIENLALNSAMAYERNEDGTLNLSKPTIEIDGQTGALTAKIFRHGVQLFYGYDTTEDEVTHYFTIKESQFDGSDQVLLVGSGWNAREAVIQIPMPETCIGMKMTIANSAIYINGSESHIGVTAYLTTKETSAGISKFFAYGGVRTNLYHDSITMQPFYSYTFVAQREGENSDNAYWYLVGIAYDSTTRV